MMEFIQYATSSFWVFCGVAILTGILGNVLVALVAVIIGTIRGGNIKFG